MPVYRINSNPPELVQADSARVGGIHTTLRGTVRVMGRPREVVLRRVPVSVRVEELPSFSAPVRAEARLPGRVVSAPTEARAGAGRGWR